MWSQSHSNGPAPFDKEKRCWRSSSDREVGLFTQMFIDAVNVCFSHIKPQPCI